MKVKEYYQPKQRLILSFIPSFVLIGGLLLLCRPDFGVFNTSALWALSVVYMTAFFFFVFYPLALPRLLHANRAWIYYALAAILTAVFVFSIPLRLAPIQNSYDVNRALQGKALILENVSQNPNQQKVSLLGYQLNEVRYNPSTLQPKESSWGIEGNNVVSQKSDPAQLVITPPEDAYCQLTLLRGPDSGVVRISMDGKTEEYNLFANKKDGNFRPDLTPLVLDHISPPPLWQKLVFHGLEFAIVYVLFLSLLPYLKHWFISENREEGRKNE